MPIPYFTALSYAGCYQQTLPIIVYYPQITPYITSGSQGSRIRNDRWYT